MVDMVITDLGVFTIDKHRPGAHRHDAGGMKLIEVAPGVTVDEIRQKTEASFTAA